ncbi:TraB/GumN family protein [Psychroserpens sp. SPM9]|uniref:TraB/GumN family protein n=1 Tax=Psychroserpens sp. SPM9 TaxID=2975598 RepID=UPI0021A84B11|nr:TraB/GumN family protein [Psychroserpens sp. SPM9]MDG5490663.1 TraB/GumN family protein [Psychroserpens sp. SPM9]
MKKIIVATVIVLCSTFGFAQDNSLLWEISGNGLTKNSYLYGTMHVSRKVAFRLDDVFFKALDKSEVVALESDPTKWLEHSYEDLDLQYNNLSYSYRDNFYSRLFKLEPVKELSVRNIIRFDNNIINGYLYRKNERSDNFEEETYLDMFIFQAGKKNGKPIIGLEDISESRFLTTKARYNPNKKKMDPWFAKMLKNENGYLIQEDVYRKRNIALLDSIGAATNTNFYREHMLFKRNENMVVVMDSVMPKTSIFAGVGAAHLAGEKGMIQMLRDRGYTVKPLTSKQTEFAQSEKEKLENLFTQPKLKVHTTPDGFLAIKSFDELREFTFNNLKYYVAPDMTNGAYLTINRLNTFDFLPSEKDKVTLDYIKDLLYEDIPGDIIEKKEINAPYPGISVLNKTKKGDYQKYHIYKTPLEIIIVKFGGKQDFVLNYESEIFDSIRFKSETEDYTTFTDPLKKYTFEFPEYYITDNLSKPGKKTVQGVIGSDYYFFQEAPNHDVSYIEEDDFEAAFIHSNFYKELKIEAFDGKLNSKAFSSYESSAELDTITHKKIWLKSIVKDGSYYLLGYVGLDHEKAQSYFNSFSVKTASYERFETVTDTSLLFTVNSTTKAPLSYRGYYSRNKKPYDEVNKTTVYTSKSNERIYVKRTKFHDLYMSEHIDSLWSDLKNDHKIFNRIKKQKPLKVFDEKQFKDQGNNIYTYSLKDSLSRKKILVKYIQKQGVVYKLSALTDDVGEPSQFISEFFNSFTPMDSLLGEDIFKDKTPQFFNALKANDSIIIDGYTELNFNKSHANALIQALKTNTFTEDREKIKTYLVGKLIQVDNSEATYNFIKQLYTDSYTAPKIQNTILNALLQRSSKKSTELVLDLMQIDVPLSNRYSQFNYYKTKSDSLKTIKQLYPDLLQYTSIEEYKKPIYSLLTKLLDSNLVKPKIYKSSKKQIINDAKIEIKRSLSKTNFSNSSHIVLEHYTKLLFPYRKESDVIAFYDRLIESKNENALTTLFVLLKKNNEPISEALKKETLYNEKAQSLLVEKLEKQKLVTDAIIKIIDLETFAKSKVVSKKFTSTKDSIVLFDKRQIETDKQQPLTLFIFKKTKKDGIRERSYLNFIAFETSDSGHYKTEPYYMTKNTLGVYLSDTTTEEEVIENQLILIKHKNRKRVSNNRSYDEFDF